MLTADRSCGCRTSGKRRGPTGAGLGAALGTGGCHTGRGWVGRTRPWTILSAVVYVSILVCHTDQSSSEWVEGGRRGGRGKGSDGMPATRWTTATRPFPNHSAQTVATKNIQPLSDPPLSNTPMSPQINFNLVSACISTEVPSPCHHEIYGAIAPISLS